MIKIRLSPSKIERYRMHVEEEYNGFITKKLLIDSITGAQTYSKKADFGTAFHLVIEKGADDFYNEKTGLYEIKGEDLAGPVVCTRNEIQHAIDFHNKYPLMNFETWITETIYVDNYEISLRMRIDGMLGNEIHENKTTGRDVKVHFYERSLQWKMYTLYTSAPVVQYNVWPYKERVDKEREVSYIPIRFYPAGVELEQEIHKNIRGLIGFCERNDLMKYLLV